MIAAGPQTRAGPSNGTSEGSGHPPDHRRRDAKRHESKAGKGPLRGGNGQTAVDAGCDRPTDLLTQPLDLPGAQRHYPFDPVVDLPSIPKDEEEREERDDPVNDEGRNVSDEVGQICDGGCARPAELFENDCLQIEGGHVDVAANPVAEPLAGMAEPGPPAPVLGALLTQKAVEVGKLPLDGNSKNGEWHDQRHQHGQRRDERGKVGITNGARPAKMDWVVDNRQQNRRDDRLQKWPRDPVDQPAGQQTEGEQEDVVNDPPARRLGRTR